MKLLRGSLSLLLLLLFLILFDPVQRLVIAPLARLFPSKRVAILGRWQHLMRWVALSPFIHVGGARFPRPLDLPGGDGVLIIMNHQSIFDIPLVVESLPVNSFARFVARKRYFKGIPTVSHLLRLYKYPSVDPRADPQGMKASLAAVRDAARKTDVPLCIFPEGTRTKDGEIGPFRPTGLKLILKQRPWKVYVLVGDGYWKTAKMKDFIRGMSDVRGKLELAGVFDWPDPTQKSDAFVEELRHAMVDRLAEMRRTPHQPVDAA
ncbi:MAG: lysophospholipid acyltransferase family protein [Longimicrobiales bacterium]|nr:lysophospholipid acyltransferase family protein [Longimicrobiales bacterium]